MGLTPHYHGPASAFPRMKEWKSFETIFNANKGTNMYGSLAYDCLCSETLSPYLYLSLYCIIKYPYFFLSVIHLFPSYHHAQTF